MMDDLEHKFWVFFCGIFLTFMIVFSVFVVVMTFAILKPVCG